MHDITIIIYTGPRAGDRQVQLVPLDVPIVDLLTNFRKDFRLPEQDARGNLITYGLFIERDGQRVRLDQQRTLRSLRLQSHADLYIADVAHLWWPLAVTDRLRPLDGQRPQPPQPVQPLQQPPPVKPPLQSPPPLAEPQPAVCIVELAQGCSRTVSENRLVITRRYLLDNLPKSIVAREQARTLIGLDSALQAVSNRQDGHCALIWARGWYLHAFRPVYLQDGQVKLDGGETFPLEQTTRLILGRQGWPITVRLSSTMLPRY